MWPERLCAVKDVSVYADQAASFYFVLREVRLAKDCQAPK